MVKVTARTNQITSVIINFESADLEEVGVSLRFSMNAFKGITKEKQEK